MKNTLQLAFDFESSEVRTITDEMGEIWFVGKDVAVALGHSNPERAIRKFVDEEDRRVTDLVTLEGTRQVKRQMTFINEPGVYALIFASQTDSAVRFKRWVTHDVLPSIREKGYYSLISDEKLLDILSERVKNKPQLVDRAFVSQKERNTFKRYVADKELADLWKQRKEIDPSDYEQRLADICNGNVSRYTKEYEKYLRWRDSYRTLQAYAESRDLNKGVIV